MCVCVFVCVWVCKSRIEKTWSGTKKIGPRALQPLYLSLPRSGVTGYLGKWVKKLDSFKTLNAKPFLGMQNTETYVEKIN